MAARVDGAGGGSQSDGTYYGSATTGSTPRTPVRRPNRKGPFPGESFDWDAAQSGDPYQAPRAQATPRLRIMPDGTIVDENSPWFYRASSRDTQADWDYQRATTERFLRFQGGATLVPAGGATQAPVVTPVQPVGTGSNGATGPGTFSPDPGAAAGGVTPSTYEYRSWTELREDERELFDTMADLFKAEYGFNSTGTSWYDQLVTDASKIRDRTGIAPDPANLAIQYANKRGYDLKPWLERVPTLSPNSVLFDRGSYARGGEVAVEGDEADSTSGGYPRGGGGGYGSGGGGGGGTVALTNPSSARGLLLQTMQGVLGRNPTEREYKDFIDTLKQTETANPRTVDFEGDLAVQSGGSDPGMLAMEFAQSAEDYKATQANKFYNAFMGALGGGLDG